MTRTATDSALIGPWHAQLMFTKGPREGEREPVTLTFLPDGVIVHADEIRVENDQLPRGIGEWTAAGDSFSYWFNVVLNDPTGRPTIVVYVHGDGTLAPDARTFTANGGSEVYSDGGALLASNLADLHATRAEDRKTERSRMPSTSNPRDSTAEYHDGDAPTTPSSLTDERAQASAERAPGARSPLDQVGTTVLFENDRVRVWDMTLEPGETCASHRHRHDYLMIYPDGALGRSSSRSRLERVEPGLVAFATVGAEGLPPHQITNAGERRSTHYVIELLGPSAAAIAQPLAHNGRVRLEDDPGDHTARDAQHDTTTTSSSHTSTSDSQPGAWERWWSEVTGAAGEVIWAADEADLAADRDVFASAFDRTLPVIDLGCGDGRQTRFLARHFETVIGVDISAAAVKRARAGENPPNVYYRVLDASSPGQAEQLHDQLGDANVYVRGVLQALPPADRPKAVRSINALLGDTGALFAKELPPQAGAYFAQAVARYGMWPDLERVMRLIPPGQITEEELDGLFPTDRFEIIATGTGRIDTINVLPDGEPIRVPAINVLARARRSASRSGTLPGRLAGQAAPAEAE